MASPSEALNLCSPEENPGECKNSGIVMGFNQDMKLWSYEEIKNQSFNIRKMCEDFRNYKTAEERSHGALCLAVASNSMVLLPDQFADIFDLIFLLTDRDQLHIPHTCYALLLHSLTKQAAKWDQLETLEEHVLQIAETVIPSEGLISQDSDVTLLGLGREYYRVAHGLCQEIFPEEILDFCGVDVLTICCSCLKSITSNKIAQRFVYSDRTLKFVLGMIGKGTQEIVSESLIEEDERDILSASSYMVDQCLNILEHVLSEDRLSHRKNLDHEDFSLLHCLTRLLGWCASFLFSKESSTEDVLSVDDPLSKFHLSTLVSILKILSILSFNPDQYNTFTNTKGLMEKVMLCILKFHFQTKGKHFDILILALELMINFYLKNKKIFVMLCLKKFKYGDEEILSIEALLKMLLNSLERIAEIQPKILLEEVESEPNEQTATPNLNSHSDNPCNSADKITNLEFSCQETGENEPEETAAKEETSEKKSEEQTVPIIEIEDEVLEAADEDMMLSGIVSFISVLLVFFMDTKESFVNFIKERLPAEKSSEAVAICNKFIRFTLITGNFPASGNLILRHAVKRLNQLFAST